jgi:hypothetical protein
MRIQPASVEQVVRANDGRYVLIDADVSTIAADLQKIDPGLKVRFAENGNPPFWAIYHESADGRSTQLILTQQAHMTRSGTWAGLDQRIVDRVRYIDARGTSGYDFAKEIERETLARPKRASEQFAERVGDGAERMAHAVRKDLGLGSYKGRVFVPREV